MYQKYCYLLLVSLLVQAACTNLKDHKTIFLEDKARFEKVLIIRDSLLCHYSGCKEFKFTLNAKSFWEECNTESCHAPHPQKFLTPEEKDFLMDFMFQDNLHAIEINERRVDFIFSGYEPDVISRTRENQDERFKQFKIDSLYYLTSYYGDEPE